MKKYILTLAIAICSLTTFSQTLSNSTWTVNDNSSAFFSYFRFNSGTLSFSSDNVNFTDVSTYQVNGNNFTVVDIPSGPCPNVIGTYTYSIQNDTLKFALIEDTCFGRAPIFISYHWVNPVTGIEDFTELSLASIYPNPASDFISIESEIGTRKLPYVIFNQLGKQVLTGKLTGETTQVDLRGLAAGLYFCHIGEERKQLIKVVKE
jgi:hypothetical protein